MPKRFSASVAGRHMACHASANLELAIPGWVEPVEDRTANNAANRGTNMHKIFASVMELPNADIRAMRDALDYIAKLRSKRKFKVLIEQEVEASWLATKPKTTPDLVLYTQDEIHVIDLKTGRIEVDAFENEQLLFAGVTLSALAPKAKGVHMHIVQPWAGGNSDWFADTIRLKQFMDAAMAAEAAIAKGDVTFGPSHHCTFCPANPHSRASQKGSPLCPAMLQILYPKHVDEDEILSL